MPLLHAIACLFRFLRLALASLSKFARLECLRRLLSRIWNYLHAKKRPPPPPGQATQRDNSTTIPCSLLPEICVRADWPSRENGARSVSRPLSIIPQHPGDVVIEMGDLVSNRTNPTTDNTTTAKSVSQADTTTNNTDSQGSRSSRDNAPNLAELLDAYSSTAPQAYATHNAESFPETSRSLSSISGPVVQDSPDGYAIEVVPPTPTDSPIELVDHRIFPIIPEFFQRYERLSFVEERETEFTIPELTLDYRDKLDPPGWKPILHPEGILYFYNEAKRTVTDADLYDERYHSQLMRNIDALEEYISVNGISLPANYTLSMDLTLTENDSFMTDYYYADHDRKVVFFLDSLEASIYLPVWYEIRGVTALRHIGHEMEAQYWFHGVLYPGTVPMTQEGVNGLRDVVFHYLGDTTSSAYSTCPWSRSELETMLSQIDSLKESVGSDSCQGATSFLCRMNHAFSRQRFYNWHGVPQVRLSRKQSVHARPPGLRGITNEKAIKRESGLLTILSPLLFSVPDVHRRNFGAIWVDGLFNSLAWKEYTTAFQAAQQDFILYSTVLLGANVAFLAIQSVDIQSTASRTPVQVASYLSTGFSIGCIIMGLLLIRQPGKDGDESQWSAVRFFATYPVLGPELYAILYSAPYAFLLYSMMAFFIAFAINCYHNANISTTVILSVVWSVPVLFLLCCVWVRWPGYFGMGP